MKRIAVLFVQMVIVLTGVGAAAVLLWEPQIEGRNAHATPFEIYFHDPFLAYAYVAAIPFFVGLFQAFRIAAYAGRGEAFSLATATAMRRIRGCALIIVAFVAGGEAFILAETTGDDPAGGVVVGIAIAVASLIVAGFATVLERTVRNGMVERGVGSAA